MSEDKTLNSLDIQAQNDQSSNDDKPKDIEGKYESLPIQYRIFADELIRLVNITTKRNNYGVVTNEQIQRLVGTLFSVDKADFAGSLVNGIGTFPSEYLIPKFMQPIILPAKMWIDNLPLQRDLINRYNDVEFNDPLNVSEWTDLINRIIAVIKARHIELDVTLSDLSELRTKYELSRLFYSASINESVRTLDVESIFETVSAIDMSDIDDVAGVSLNLYLKRKLNN